MAELAAALSAQGSRLRARWQRASRTGVTPELVALVVGTLVLATLIVTQPTWAPLILLVVPMLVSSLVLGPRHLPWFVVFLLLVLSVTVARQPTLSVRLAVSVAVLFSLGFIILLASFRRTRLGVAGMMGESMLVDLRDRILQQGAIPTLPSRWYAAWSLRSAGGTAFSGDFVVAARPPGTDRLELAVVDVSGKGEEAGTRALLLSGAFGGLLGALGPEEFLPAANEYLLRQEWEEGFATAVHLSLDLQTGAYEVRTAGHPPAVLHDAGSGRWDVVESQGPLLGLVPDATFTPGRGVLGRHDAMMLYTDGMVETRGIDIGLGIDRMLGQTERVLRGDFEQGPDRLVETVGARDDDRALLIVHRRA